MDLDNIENLNEEQILNLYNDVIEMGESRLIATYYSCYNGEFRECDGNGCTTIGYCK